MVCIHLAVLQLVVNPAGQLLLIAINSGLIAEWIASEEVPHVFKLEIVQLDSRSLANSQTIRAKDRHSCISGS